LVFLLACTTAVGYIFTCLDGCDCDTDDEAIHCHHGDRDALPLPANRLRGFSVLGFTRNNIRQLPSQAVLLQKFPDLKAVDVEGNPNFNCSTLDYYDRVVVMSDCGKSQEELLNNTLPSTPEPTADCDFACQRDRHVKSLQDYLIRLWRMIKSKMAELKRENRWMQDVEDFFNEWTQKISDTLKDLGSDGKKVAHAELEDNSSTAQAISEATTAQENNDNTSGEKHVHIGNSVGRRKFFHRR